ncbi:MAG: NAD(P)H-dependent oxidoreductase [Oligoflexia bacterium]|nr:NAD(P)H-dependent oxidoreductase [Oligoflexia bacterium]
MKLIITSTNRKNSLTAITAKIIQKIYQNLEEEFEILDLRDIPFEHIVKEPYASQVHPSLKVYLDKVAQSSALVIICPEYNGGIPGLIKHFIDHWIYPDSFVYKPVCLIGLGGKFGALNPISHLQSIFLYRHSFVFPIRVFIQNVSQIIKKDKILDDNVNQLLLKQAKNFVKFIKALEKQSFS